MDKEDRNDYQYCQCVWCGNWITKHTYAKRLERKLDPDVCKDCRDVRKSAGLEKYRRVITQHPELGAMRCSIWYGELNDDWLPIDDDGKLFMPGIRICGMKDCINSEHVIPPKKPQVSDVDLILMSMEVRKKHKKVGQNG
jgi:hypothetical protein